MDELDKLIQDFQKSLGRELTPEQVSKIKTTYEGNTQGFFDDMLNTLSREKNRYFNVNERVRLKMNYGIPQNFKEKLALAETRGQGLGYDTSATGSSGLGPYQITRSNHETAIKNKLGADWDQFQNDPKLQDDYMGVLEQDYERMLPKYRGYSYAKQQGLTDDEVKAAIHVLGPSGAQSYLQTGQINEPDPELKARKERDITQTLSFFKDGVSAYEPNVKTKEQNSPTPPTPPKVSGNYNTTIDWGAGTASVATPNISRGTTDVGGVQVAEAIDWTNQQSKVAFREDGDSYNILPTTPTTSELQNNYRKSLSNYDKTVALRDEQPEEKFRKIEGSPYTWSSVNTEPVRGIYKISKDQYASRNTFEPSTEDKEKTLEKDRETFINDGEQLLNTVKANINLTPDSYIDTQIYKDKQGTIMGFGGDMRAEQEYRMNGADIALSQFEDAAQILMGKLSDKHPEFESFLQDISEVKTKEQYQSVLTKYPSITNDPEYQDYENIRQAYNKFNQFKGGVLNLISEIDPETSQLYKDKEYSGKIRDKRLYNLPLTDESEGGMISEGVDIAMRNFGRFAGRTETMIGSIVGSIPGLETQGGKLMRRGQDLIDLNPKSSDYDGMFVENYVDVGGFRVVYTDSKKKEVAYVRDKETGKQINTPINQIFVDIDGEQSNLKEAADKGEVKVNRNGKVFGSMAFDTLLDLAPQVGGTAAVAKLVGKMGVKRATAYTIGQGFSAFHQVRGGALNELMKVPTLSQDERENIANTLGAFTAIVSNINPEAKALAMGTFAQSTQQFIKRNAAKIASGQMSARDIAKFGITQVYSGTKAAVKESAEEVSELVFENNVVNPIVNENLKLNLEEGTTPEELETTIAVAATIGLAADAAGNFNLNFKNPLHKQAFVFATQDPEIFEAYVDGVKVVNPDFGAKIDKVFSPIIQELSTLDKKPTEEQTVFIAEKLFEAKRIQDKIDNTQNPVRKEELKLQLESIYQELSQKGKEVERNPKTPPKPVVEEEEETTATSTTTSKSATTQPTQNKVRAYDFDGTLFDNKTGKLTTLGEEVKARIEAGEDITIVTARNKDNVQQISDALSISPDKIEATGDENLKRGVLDAKGISTDEYFDADATKLSNIKNGVTKQKEVSFESTQKLGDYIDTPVIFEGKRGTLQTRTEPDKKGNPQTFFTVKVGNEVFDIGDVNNETDLETAGVQLADAVQVTKEGNFDIRGQVYQNVFSTPITAIDKDKDGNYIVRLDTVEDTPQARTFRGQIAEDLAYQITLQEITKNNEKEFNDFLTDKDTKGEIPQPVAEATTPTNGRVSQKQGEVKTPPKSVKKSSVVSTATTTEKVAQNRANEPTEANIIEGFEVVTPKGNVVTGKTFTKEADGTWRARVKKGDKLSGGTEVKLPQIVQQLEKELAKRNGTTNKINTNEKESSNKTKTKSETRREEGQVGTTVAQKGEKVKPAATPTLTTVLEKLGTSQTQVKAQIKKFFTDRIPGITPEQSERLAEANLVMWNAIAKTLGGGMRSVDYMKKKIAMLGVIPTSVDAKNLAAQQRASIKFQIIGEKGAAALDAAEESNVRINNLQVAREMEAAGNDVEFIRWSTGWERGVDQKWRYEVKDLSVRSTNFDFLVKKLNTISTAKAAELKLSDLVAFSDPLLKAYPNLGKVKVVISRGNGSTLGSYDKDKNQIDLFIVDGYDSESMKSTLLHEVQHKIQEEEGFARGGNTDTKFLSSLLPDDFIAGAKNALLSFRRAQNRDIPQKFEQLNKELKRLEDKLEDIIRVVKNYSKNQDIAEVKAELKKLGLNDILSPSDIRNNDVSKKIEDLRKKVEKSRKIVQDRSKKIKKIQDLKTREDIAPYLDGDSIYRRLIGEVEARNVQTRMQMTPEQRKETLLRDTEDVHEKFQIELLQSFESLEKEITQGNIRLQPENKEDRYTKMKDSFFGGEEPNTNRLFFADATNEFNHRGDNRADIVLFTDGASFWLNEGPDGFVTIEDFQVNDDKIGTGVGRDALIKLLKYADNNGITLIGDPLSQNDRGRGSKGLSQKNLVDFYKRYGFTKISKDSLTKNRSAENVFLERKPVSVAFQTEDNQTLPQVTENIVNNAIDHLTELNKKGLQLLRGVNDKATRKNIQQTIQQNTKTIAHLKKMQKDPRFQVDAYHGTPYVFDKFSTSKIGTGEGNQMFGWGLYFTDLENIAKHYAKGLTPKEKYSFEGIDNIDNIATHPMTKSFIGDMLKTNPTSRQDAINWVERNSKGKSEKVVTELMYFAKILNIDNSVNRNLYKVSLHEGKIPYKYVPTQPSFWGGDWMLSTEEIIDGKRQSYKENEASRYKRFKTKKEAEKYIEDNNLNNSYTWLEWDKPVPKETIDKLKLFQNEREYYYNILLAKHPEFKTDLDKSTTQQLKESISDPIDSHEEYLKKNIKNGEELYKQLVDEFGSQEKASLFLLENGIDGVKYPEGTIARGTTSDTARGFNYVVFDENAITIKERVQFQQDAARFRGAAIALANGQHIIAALESPIPTTFAHEAIWHATVEDVMSGEEKQAFIEEYNSVFGDNAADWNTDVSEYTARVYEKYLSNGRKLTETEVKDEKRRNILQQAFDTFTELMKDLYNSVIEYNNSKGVKREISLSPQAQAFFDRITGIAPQTQTETTTGADTTVSEPSLEQQAKELKEGDVTTFEYKSESEVPGVLKDKISSRGEINGKPFVKVTMAKSLADFHLQSKSTQTPQETKQEKDFQKETLNTPVEQTMAELIQDPNSASMLDSDMQALVLEYAQSVGIQIDGLKKNCK